MLHATITFIPWLVVEFQLNHINRIIIYLQVHVAKLL